MHAIEKKNVSVINNAGERRELRNTNARNHSQLEQSVQMLESVVADVCQVIHRQRPANVHATTFSEIMSTQRFLVASCCLRSHLQRVKAIQARKR